jgi:hypothetical protein
MAPKYIKCSVANSDMKDLGSGALKSLLLIFSERWASDAFHIYKIL